MGFSLFAADQLPAPIKGTGHERAIADWKKNRIQESKDR